MPRSIVSQVPIFNVVSVEQDRRHWDGYMQNWNFAVGRELTAADVLEVSYVASKGTHLDTSVSNWNSPEPGPGAIQARRPYPQFGRIRMAATDANSVYHSLQSRYERRFTRGLSATASYSWSHLIDDAANTANRGACGCQDPRNRGRAERADSVSDVRHRFVAGWVWEIPGAARLKPAARAFIGGWSLGGILTLQSGSPFNVVQSGDTLNNDPNGWTRPNLVSGQQSALPVSDRDPVRWFNSAAFARTTVTHGTTPRNALVGPGLKTIDFSVSKDFVMPYRESHRLTFRAEFFNGLNTPQFANPGSNLGTGTFGQVTGTSSDNRQIQLALKYVF